MFSCTQAINRVKILREKVKNRTTDTTDDTGVPSSFPIDAVNGINESMSLLVSLNGNSESSDSRAKGAKFRHKFNYPSSLRNLKKGEKCRCNASYCAIHQQHQEILRFIEFLSKRVINSN